MQNFNRFF